MKVLFQQFLGANHSWSIVGQNIARHMIKQGHDVHLCSTNGITHFPEDLKSNLIGYADYGGKEYFGTMPDDNYDMQFSYTAFKNAPKYLGHGDKNRFLLYTYEFAGKNALPDGFAKFYKFSDKILPPSNFAKKVFLDSGIPEEHMVVIPHGIDFEHVILAEPVKLKTTKSNKILIVVAQVHARKNLPGMLEMFGKAFSKKDDVCLVLKVQDRPATMPFELDFGKLYADFCNKFKDHAEVEIIREFIPNIYSLYKACDIVFSASHCEGFGITALDAHALGKINIVSNYGGFTDFSTADNSLLIEGKEFFVPPSWLYWANKRKTIAFMPSVESGVEQLQKAVAQKERLLKKFQQNIKMVKEKYNWEKITNQIIGLCK